MTPTELAALIRQHLPDSQVTVNSTDNVHFDAVVVSEAFVDRRKLQRHRLVYAALGARMGGEVHALSIQAYTPAEWQARQP